jgi:RNA polymerase sigma-70 factor (ECF subfamily)
VEEALLLERAKEYDLVALGEIYDTYSIKIYNYVYRRLGDVHLAEDITADVFVRMLEALQHKKFAKICLSAWLYRIAHNLIVDHFRRTSREELFSLDEQLMAASLNTADAVKRRLAQQQLRAAISRLPETQQQVIMLKFVEGLSNAEVAQVLGKTNGAVKALQHRALASLRRILEEQDE